MYINLTDRKLDKLTLAQKKALYKSSKRAYYNAEPIMSDAAFDMLEDNLKAVAPKWVGLKAAGAPIEKNVKKKVKLPINMFSLDKVKPANAAAWLSKQTGPGVVSLKADGASLEVIYRGGQPVQAITRGDGRIGGDVSYLLPHMKIPQKISTKSEAILRCEVLFTTKAFSKYREVFDAARNAASGLLNRQDVHTAVKDLSVVVLQVLKPNPQLSKGLAWAKAQGFTVIPYKVVRDVSQISAEKLTKLLTAQKAKAKFQIDGLVVALDAVNPLPKSGNPAWAVAFKTEDTGSVLAEVVRVEWDVSHLGTLVPVAILKVPS